MEIALGLAALALILVAPAVGRELRRNNLAITLVRELADPHRTGPEPEPEARPSLTLSTLTLCPPGQAHCSTCVRAQVALPCRVLPRNIVLDFLELSSNRHWEVRVRGRRRATTETWKWQEQRRAWKILEPPDPQLNSSHTPRTWQLSYECFEAEGGRDVLVSVSSSELQEPVSVAYTVEDSERGPVFNVTLDGPARALVVSVLPGPVLKARLCYQHFIVCDDLSPPVTGLVDPSEALSARLSFPLLLPCLCVEVYRLGYDHWRRTACPLKDQPWDTRADDLWRSSTIHFLGQRSGSTLTLRWDSPCPLPDSSASLCWRDSETAPSACRVIVNSTLKREDSVYTISGVDRHPQLCVQLSYKDSYHVECPFGPGDTDWTAEVTPAGSLQHLRITSGVPASFSAGLCRREEGRCVPVAPVHSASLDSSSNATELRMTLSSPGPWLCVQVWRTDVAFSAKTLLCPYNPNGRLGLMALATLILSFSATLLLFLGYLGVRRRLSGPVWQHKPVLLVSSSDSEPQVSAVCALASLLQRELCCEVQLSHWAQGALAQLGPVPWLYGQREAVRRAEGRVLIAWSPEGREVYQRWRGGRAGGEGGGGREGERSSRRQEEETEGEERRRKERGAAEGEGKEKRGRRAGRANRRGGEGRGRKKREQGAKRPKGAARRAEEEWRLCAGREGEEGSGTKQGPCSYTSPVLQAALACLLSELGGGGGGEFALVSFTGLCHSRDIPQRLSGLPHYRLPRDFGRLVEELQGGRGGCRRCWARLLTKTLAHRLACQLAAWLWSPWRQGERHRRGKGHHDHRKGKRRSSRR